MLPVAHQCHPGRIDRLDGPHAISLDARNLHQTIQGIARHAEKCAIALSVAF
jgi:hypothetical protein